MPSTPYALAQASINGGAPVTGYNVVTGGQTVQLSLQSTVGVQVCLWEVMGPKTWAGPGGAWTYNSNTGRWYYYGLTPPLITLPALTASSWWKWLVQVTVNNNLPLTNPNLFDNSLLLSMLSNTGQEGVAYGEGGQEDQLRQWLAALEITMHAIEAALAGSFPPSGAAGGSLTGTYPNPGVGQVDGSAGNVPVLAAQATWGPFNFVAAGGHAGRAKRISKTDGVISSDASTHIPSTIAIDDLTTVMVTVDVLVFQGSKWAAWSLTQAFTRNGGGAVANASATQVNFSAGSNAGAPPADFPTPTLTASGNNCIVTIQDVNAGLDYWTSEWSLPIVTKVS